MIIQIRGTSGSGKSWVMRKVMYTMGDWQGEYIDGRKKPLYYHSVGDWPLTLVPGHYESNCGGCDNIGSAAEVFKLTQTLLLVRQHTVPNIIEEGLLLSEDAKWTPQLKDVHCLFLSTPIEQCISQIKTRRASIGNEKPLNEANTRNRVNAIERARLRLIEAGVDCRRCSPEQAVKLILKMLRSSNVQA
jgi:hypothetical protein